MPRPLRDHPEIGLALQPRGELLSRVTNDIDNVAQSLQQTLSNTLTAMLILIGTAAMMVSISPVLAVIALITVPISVFSMKQIAGRVAFYNELLDITVDGVRLDRPNSPFSSREQRPGTD